MHPVLLNNIQSESHLQSALNLPTGVAIEEVMVNEDFIVLAAENRIVSQENDEDAILPMGVAINKMIVNEDSIVHIAENRIVSQENDEDAIILDDSNDSINSADEEDDSSCIFSDAHSDDYSDANVDSMRKYASIRGDEHMCMAQTNGKTVCFELDWGFWLSKCGHINSKEDSSIESACEHSAKDETEAISSSTSSNIDNHLLHPEDSPPKPNAATP